MQTEERQVDWEQAKRCLALLEKESKDFLHQALLIGGAACFFYANRLIKANDPDFRLVPPTPNDDNPWVSRDIDFTGIFSQEALDKLPHCVVERDGKRIILVDGVRCGFAQAGVTFEPVEAIENAWAGSFVTDGKKVEFIIIDPVTLYYEKCKLCAQRGNKNDFLHRKMLFDYIAYELVRGAEEVLNDVKHPFVETKAVLRLWLKVYNKTPEILQDRRVLDRLKPLLANNPSHIIAQYVAKAQTS